MTTWPTVMVTGHRPNHFTHAQQTWVRQALLDLAVRLRDRRGMTTGISGMATGSDLWWADAVVKAGVRLEAHVPFGGQESTWPSDDRHEYHRLLSKAVRIPPPTGTYAKGSFHRRNHAMVRASDQAVVVWRHGDRGGTWATLKYALSLGLRPLWVNPDAQLIEWPTVEGWRQLVVPQPRARTGQRVGRAG